MRDAFLAYVVVAAFVSVVVAVGQFDVVILVLLALLVSSYFVVWLLLLLMHLLCCGCWCFNLFLLCMMRHLAAWRCCVFSGWTFFVGLLPLVLVFCYQFLLCVMLHVAAWHCYLLSHGEMLLLFLFCMWYVFWDILLLYYRVCVKLLCGK